MSSGQQAIARSIRAMLAQHRDVFSVIDPRETRQQILARLPDQGAECHDFLARIEERVTSDQLLIPRNVRLLRDDANVMTFRGHSGLVLHVAALPDGLALSASSDRTCKALGPGLGGMPARPGGTFRVRQSRRGAARRKRALSASSDHALRLWDLASGRCLHVLEGHSGPVNQVAALPGGGRALSASSDKSLPALGPRLGGMPARPSGTFRLGQTRRGAARRARALGVMGRDDPVALGRRLGEMLARAGGTFEYHQSRRGAARRPRRSRRHRRQDPAALGPRPGKMPAGPKRAFRSGNQVATLPDGRALSASGDGTLRLWDVASGECLRALEGHSGSVTYIAALPEGRVLSASDYNTLRLWDLASGECLRVLEGHSFWVRHVMPLPDERALSASYDKTLRLWDLATCQCLRVLEGHSGWVNQVAALPDGRALSASEDRTLRLWDLASG